MRSLIAITAVLLASALPAFADQNQRTTTVTTARGDTITRTRSHGGHQASASTVVSTAAGRMATASRTTYKQDDAIVHHASRTGFAGRTASKQGVYTRDGSTHTRTGRGGRTVSWSRSR